MRLQLLQALLLLVLVAGEAALGAASPQKWRRCGSLQLPSPAVALRPTQRNDWSRVLLDPSGTLHCSCSERDVADAETLRVDFVGERERIIESMNLKVSPCVEAACVPADSASHLANTVEPPSFTSAELIPADCGKSAILRKTADLGLEIVPGEDLDETRLALHCREPSIALSQTLQLSHAVSSTRTPTIRWLIPLDLHSCAHSLKQDRTASSPTSQVVFFRANEKDFPCNFSRVTRTRHEIARRSNNPPSFLYSYYSAEVVENSAVGTLVTTVQASDIDEGSAGEITYSMVPNVNAISGDYFEIHNISGDITTTGEIDREEMASHSFHVTATDGSGLTATVVYSISVADKNDNTPYFSLGNLYHIDIDEDQDLNEAVLTLEVVDEDEGLNSEVSFSLQNNTGGTFSITAPPPSSSGTYTSSLVLIRPLDYETLDLYQLTIVARDAGAQSRSSVANVEVVVQDVVDNPPVFTSSEFTVEVPEDAGVGTTVFQLNATTLDSPDIAEVSYHLQSFSPPDFRFSLEINTGVIRVHNKLDFEQAELYSLSVRAQTAPGLETSVTITINIVNVNDNSPHFLHSAYSGSVMEGLPALHRVLTVRATDNDNGIFGQISYSIASNDSNILGKFVLNSTTGEIRTLAVLDHETQTEYSFDVVVMDGGNPARQDLATVTIQVENQNDELPVFVSLIYNRTIVENSGAGVSVVQVEARDADSPSLEYHLHNIELRSLFSVELTSGLISTRQNLDREDGNFYTLEIMASDGQLTSPENAVVYVTVSDVNDETPIFQTSGYSVALSELRPVNSTVIEVVAIDGDEPGPNSELTYSSPHLPPYFSLSPHSGVIKIAQPVDYETNNYFNFLVWATDGGAMPLSSSAVIEVTVIDENDNAPQFDSVSRKQSVPENEAAFVLVFQLSATDADSGSNAELEYEIISDASAREAFIVDSMGVVKTSRVLDREQTALYLLTVEVRDKGSTPLSSTIDVEVEVSDVIDDPPMFDFNIYSREIAEETPIWSPLLTVAAETRDTVSSILYQANGMNRTLFNINQISGVISAATNIDPVTHRGSYSFHVTAQHQQFSATTTVQIEILPDTRTPRLKPLSVYFNVYTALLSPWTALGAVELEKPHERPLTFSLSSSDPATRRFFFINSATGSVSVSSAARRGHYSLEITAASAIGVGKGTVEVYVHTLSNKTLESSVVVEFGSESEIHFVSVTLESFAAALTEIVPCAREQVEIVGVQETPSGGLSVIVAVRERDMLSYLSHEVLLDRLLANKGSSRLQNVVNFWSEACVSEPCPNFQQCAPVVHIQQVSSQRVFKVLQSRKQIYISHPFSRSFTCHCPPGNDLGDLCSIETDPCTPSPCHFDAPCHKLSHGDYVCECPPYTAGKNCSNVCPSASCQPCLPDPCLHGSHCLEFNDLTSYSCVSCPWAQSHAGHNCELTAMHVSPGGYVVLPSLKSVVKTKISFKFTTVLPDGIVLYAGRVSGSHDLLSVNIVKGQVRVTISLGNPDELVTMTTNSVWRLNDGEWHDVELYLEGQQQRLTVTVSECSDGPVSSFLTGRGVEACTLQGTIATRNKSLDVDTMLYFGGVEPHISLPLFSRTLPNFQGCLSDLVMDDQIIDLASPVRQHATSVGCPPREKVCSFGSCFAGDCIPVWNGTICHCEDSPECQQSSSAVSLSHGYLGLQLPAGSVFTVETFSLAFITRQSRATLVTFGQTASLQLNDGSLVFSHNSSSSHSTSSHLTTLTLHTTVSDGLWHTVTMATSAVAGTRLSIDSDRATTTHPHLLTHTITSLTLGTSITNDNHFNGCLADFSINIQRIDLALAANTTSNTIFSDIQSLNAEPGCGPGSECSSSTCPAHSVCVDEWRTHSCVCEEGFVSTDEGTCLDPCDTNPCGNRGACVVENEGVRCECVMGYSGERCEEVEGEGCPAGHHGETECRPCYCHLEGVTGDMCESSGRCLCNSSLHVFSPPGDLGCQPCDCHMTGSLSQQCLPSTGECPCRPGVTGRRCDVCMVGYAGMDDDGCKEAVEVRGLFTLSTVVYESGLDRRGSRELHLLTSTVAYQLKKAMERFAIQGEIEVAITNFRNSSDRVTVNYTISSFSKYASHPLPVGHAHTLASVAQWVVKSGWVGPYQVDSASHILLTDCRVCDPLSRCVITETSSEHPQTFTCDTCPDQHSLDGILCRKIANESCIGLDTDQDGVGNHCDNCPYLFNPSQHPDDCATPTNTCPVGHSDGGVLWSSVPEHLTAVSPCQPPQIGYVRRQCLARGVWEEEVDRRDCLSLRAQQFLADAESLRLGKLMNIHELLYHLSDVGSYVRGGVSGGDLGAVGRLVREVMIQQVDSTSGAPTENHGQLIEVIATAISNLLSPSHTHSWTTSSAQFTGFLPSLFPSTLELFSDLFRLHQARGGLSRPHLVVMAMLNFTSANFSGDVVDLCVENGTKSSVSLPPDLGKARNKSVGHFDVVVGVYPTLSPLLLPSEVNANMSVASVVMTIQVWHEGVAHSNLSTPVVITLAHIRKVHVYSVGTAKCVTWQDSSEPGAGWAEGAGCEVTQGNETHTTCTCHHLSTFSVLLPSSSFLAVEVGDGDRDFHPGIFTYVSLTLSAFLLLLASLALWIVRWSSGNVYVTVYKNLLLSLLLTAVSFLVGIDQTDPPVLCSVFAILLDFLLISSLFWLLVVGVATSRLLLHPPPRSSNCFTTTTIIAGLWTVPALLCVVPVGVVAMASSTFHQGFGYPHYCLVVPEMALVLLTPLALLLILFAVVLTVVVVQMKTQKSRRRQGSENYATTPGKIAATQNRARRHLAITTVSLFLYLTSLSSALLTVYHHLLPAVAGPILETVFAISFTCLSGFLFIVLALNKKIRGAVVAKFEPKYQNSSLRAIADSSSLLTRLRVVGRARERETLSRTVVPGRESQSQQYSPRQQWLRNGQRVEARNRLTRSEQLTGEATSIDLVSMEVHPRTPNTEPLYSQVAPRTDRHRHTTTSSNRPTATAGLPQRADGHLSRQPHPVLRPSRLDPPVSSSGADADMDTDDVESGIAALGQQPWYHASGSEFHEPVRSGSAEDSGGQGVSDNDDTSRVDPSGVSTISGGGQSDVEEGVRWDCGEGVRRDGGESVRRDGGEDVRREGSAGVCCDSVRELETGRGSTRESRESVNVSQRPRGSRESVDGSLCVQTSHCGSLERKTHDISRHERHRESSYSDGGLLEMGRGGEERDELEELSSPQPCVDPMWYRRGSGCEELGNMPTVGSTERGLGQLTAVREQGGGGGAHSQQKSVTWADLEEGARKANLRYSCDSYSSLSSRSIHLEPPSASSSPHESSPTPTLTPGYPGGPSVATPLSSSRRPPPEGMGAAVVLFPSPTRQQHQRRSSPGSIPPLSPTSLSSGSSSPHSGQVLAPRARLPLPATRGVAVGQSPASKATTRVSPVNYHSNGPSAQHYTNSAHHRNRPQTHVRDNLDGSKTVRSLV